MADTQSDWRTATILVSQVAEEAKSEADKARAVASGSKVAFVVDVTITHSAMLSAGSPGTRMKQFDVPAAKIGDRVYVHRNGEPSMTGANIGGSIMLEGTGYVPSDGKVNVYHSVPAVGLGHTLTIPLRLVGSRAASS